MSDPQTENLATWVQHWRDIANRYEADATAYRIAINRAKVELLIGHSGKALEILAAVCMEQGK